MIGELKNRIINVLCKIFIVSNRENFLELNCKKLTFLLNIKSLNFT